MRVKKRAKVDIILQAHDFERRDGASRAKNDNNCKILTQ